jgi:hypothetical protein
MNRKPKLVALFGLILILLALGACSALTETPATSVDGLLVPLSTDASGLVINAQATLAALQTQEKNGLDAQAAATAEIMRADAQATLDAVAATLSAAQTQEQNNADINAAQMTATAEINRANAQSTLVAAGSTQSAAQTQDAIRETQVQSNLQMTSDLATQNAVGTVTQQYNNAIAASTQTAIADRIATQTQAVLATSQWYADQSRQRTEQGLGQIAFLGMFCLPIFVGLSLWGYWRWMKTRDAQLRLNMQPAAPAPGIVEHEPGPLHQDTQYPLAKPNDQVHQWMQEVRRKLIANKEDDNDKPGI